MSMISKAKKPEKAVSKQSKKYYTTSSNLFIEEGTTTVGFRYDQVVGRKLKKPDGTIFPNNVTLSQASSEVLTLIKRDGVWCFIFGKQTRSPYLVEVDGKVYTKVFIEQAAGLLEKNQNFVQAAIAEVKQEFGAKLSYLGVFIPKVCRHVSYADERSKVFLAIAESIGKQHLDDNENIKTIIIPLDEAKEEFEAYLEGRKRFFYGFDVPDLTILALERFFWMLDTGKLDLDNLKGNLLR